MILGFDIGNTHICPIFYNNDGEILQKFRLPTKTIYTEDSLFSILKVLSNEKGFNLSEVKDVIISSVVPHLNEIFLYLSKKYFKKDAYLLTSNFLTDDILKLTNAKERNLGSDRILAILASQKRYGNRACIIIDFGTATTFEFIKNREYLGGVILPGIELSIEALFNNTAKLPKVRFEKPDSVLANSTISQINAGIYHLNVGGIKELINEYRKFEKDIYVVSTGGQGFKITEELKDYINEYVPNLCEEGLFEFYKIISSK